MKEKLTIHVSVHGLIDWSLEEGSISMAFMPVRRLAEGIAGHNDVRTQRPENYRSEVRLSYTHERALSILEIDGRADGVFERNGIPYIEEIKTTYRALHSVVDADDPIYWTQARIYAYMLALTEKADTVGYDLTYYQLNTEEEKTFSECTTKKALELFVLPLCDAYAVWMEQREHWSLLRNRSIQTLSFPFSTFRKGQEDVVESVFSAITNKERAFCQAPTGIGKTMAVLFPAVRALGNGFVDKIFYLTAKTSVQFYAEQALHMMRFKGLHLRSVTITAKEKICPNPNADCTPDSCVYARGYYERIKPALKEILENEAIERALIEQVADRHAICPYELSLDASLWSDCIVCDYNYAFDPRVNLKRYFEDVKGKYVFCIDEAHNCVDRARDMFSAEVRKKMFMEIKKLAKHCDPDLAAEAQILNQWFLDYRADIRESGMDVFLEKKPSKKFFAALKKFCAAAEETMKSSYARSLQPALNDAFYAAYGFIKTGEAMDTRYQTYVLESGDDIRIKLFCIDPSRRMKDVLKRAVSAVFFSATLTPMRYFADMMGVDEPQEISLPSPFPQENFCVMIAGALSTRYKDRSASYVVLAEYIATFAGVKTGNYLIFFPSFAYMHTVVPHVRALLPGSSIIIQEQRMSDDERAGFLERFHDFGARTLVGFAVLGGIFGEGVDLIGDKLSGAVIVGVGLPQVCLERELIKNYCDEVSENGFAYSYVYPGINRVLQAAGRVIRSEEDRGAVLLIDDRFLQRGYRELYPPEWKPVRCNSPEDVNETLEQFWGR